MPVIAILALLFAVCACAGEKENYTGIFEQDKVIDISIDIDDADLEDMRNYPENEEYHSADVTVDGIKVENAGIRTKGNMTLRSVTNSESERYSYRIKFNKYIKGNKLLGLDELCLNNGYSDPSYMREYLHYEILRELGMNVPETAFCRVYINGEYAGFYLAVEGLDSTFLKDNFGENYKDGNFYKMDEGSTLEYREDETYSYADLKSGDDENLSEFKKFVKALNDVPTGEKGDIESFLNVDSALKYIASNTVLSNYDSYSGNMHHNFYLYEDENGVFTVVPWDFNMSFGGFNGDNAEVGIDTPFISGSLETLPLINKLLSVPEYKEKYYEYINRIIDILGDFESRVAEVKAVIGDYVKNDTTAFYTYDEFEKATSAESTTSDGTQNRGKGFGGGSIISCVEKRIENIKAQFEGSASKTTETSQKGGGRDFGGMRPNGENGGRPGMGENGGMNGNMQPPEMTNGESGNVQPPQMPNGEIGNMQPPEMPNGDNGNMQPPQMPNGESGNMQPPQNTNENGGAEEGGTNRRPGRDNSAKNNSIRVHVNGHIISFENEPYIKDGYTLVGFRAILEALGAKVDWNAETKTVTAEKDGTTVTLTIGSDKAYVNGEECTLSASPELSGNSTVIPLRFISENLGMKVSWDEGTKLITVTSK